MKKLVIPRHMMGKTRLMITGAGFGPAIDATTQKIASRVSMAMMRYEDIIHSIGEILREVYEKDLPLYPYYRVDPTAVDFKLLICFQSEDGYGGLFSTNGTLVSRVESFEVIGSGDVTKFFAHMMYRKTRWDSPILKISEGTVLAAYLIHLAKQQLSSIGGQSQIATLNWEGEFNLASEWDVPRWEGFFTEYQYHSNAIMLDCADPTTTEGEFNSRLDGMVLALKASKAGLIREKQEWDRIWKPIVDAVHVSSKQSASKNSEINKDEGQSDSA